MIYWFPIDKKLITAACVRVRGKIDLLVIFTARSVLIEQVRETATNA